MGVKITIRAILFNIFQPHVTTRFNELLILLVNLMKYCIEGKIEGRRSRLDY